MSKEDNQEIIKGNEKKKFNLQDIVFISLLSGINVGLNLLIATPLKIVVPHIILGLFIMVPLDFIFIILCKLLVNKFWTSSLYLFIFSILALPTTMFGAVPGFYKIIVGLTLGVSLDLILIPQNKKIRIILGGIFGGICWWLLLFIIWQLIYPISSGSPNMVYIFSNLLNEGAIDLSNIINLPITEFNCDLIKFGTVVGLLGAIPCLIGCIFGFILYQQIEKTVIFNKFQNTY